MTAGYKIQDEALLNIYIKAEQSSIHTNGTVAFAASVAQISKNWGCLVLEFLAVGDINSQGRGSPGVFVEGKGCTAAEFQYRLGFQGKADWFGLERA